MLRNVHIWGLPLIYRRYRRFGSRKEVAGTKHILFCVADHFEPKWNDPTTEQELERVQRWVEDYPKIASVHRDSNSRPVQHTWFYAAEQYNPVCLDKLNKLCSLGFGEIELHLHHSNDTPQGLMEKLERANQQFSSHGAFITHNNPPRYAFGFIHGNWALNNSRGGLYCGVNNELSILRNAGCYADFTLPSAPEESQTRTVNTIYYASDLPGRSKSHDKGREVEVGGSESGDLMLIQGPLTLNWKRRKWGFLPRIENGCVQHSNPGTPDRIDLWIQQHIHVRGRPEWVFVKVYCHGVQEQDKNVLLGDEAHAMFDYLEDKYNDGKDYRLHYVTARELYNIVKAAEKGYSGNPFEFKDYLIPPYKSSDRCHVGER
jgi:hypothetical protein